MGVRSSLPQWSHGGSMKIIRCLFDDYRIAGSPLGQASPPPSIGIKPRRELRRVRIITRNVHALDVPYASDSNHHFPKLFFPLSVNSANFSICNLLQITKRKARLFARFFFLYYYSSLFHIEMRASFRNAHSIN